MATYQVSAPEQFNFSQPETWQRWIQRFKRFRQASGLSEKDDEVQVNTLIYTMGSNAEDILTSLNLDADDRKKYDTVEKKFEEYFVVRRNTIYERAKFNQRKQLEGESVDTFITSLYHLAEHCNYGELHDEMIRDRIVVGLLDEKLAVKLQLDAQLTLESAAKQARQSESIKKQQGVVRNEVGEQKVDFVKSNTRRGKGGNSNRFNSNKNVNKPVSHCATNYSQQTQNHRNGTNQKSKCTRCGYSPSHSRDVCPAKDKVCSKCKKRGHFQRCCLFQVGEVSDNNNRSNQEYNSIVNKERAFLGEVKGPNSKPWLVNINVPELNETVKFKIDTGADVTVIPSNMCKNIVLRKADKTLHGPGQNTLVVRGMFSGSLQTSDEVVNQNIYVVDGLKQPLLGRPAIECLNLVTCVNVDEIGKNTDSSLIQRKYPELFTGLGKLQGKYTIKLRSDAYPFALTTPRRVPIPLLPSVKEELQRMEDLGVIARIDEPTDWCAGMVVVPKANKKVRICVDLTKLNECVEREKHPLPIIDQTLGQLTGAKIFSKLDANSGFWQVELAEESALLTTFITPFGRYYFRRLPFGISSAPEHFQKKMQKILEGCIGVVCQTDDMVVYGPNQSEHDARLETVLKKLQNAGVTLNQDKCEFNRTEIKFVGHVINGQGIKPDPDRVIAIKNMDVPTDVASVRRFLGMVNQLGKFIPNLAEKTKPIRDLLSTKNAFVWGTGQQNAFQSIKDEMCSESVLALYDPNKNTIVSADASSYGLGAVITQVQDNGERKAVAYSSRSLTPTEQRYAQIEKEALALTWACDRFHDYLIGLKFKLETDHKPLVPLLGSKPLNELPARVQRFRMRLMRFSYTISHVPGKELYTPDALSRAPLRRRTLPEETEFESETTCFVDYIVENIPATDKRLDQIRTELEIDPVCNKLMSLTLKGWPDNRNNVDELVKPYWGVRGELTVINGLLFKGERLVIPSALRADILERIHEGHLGIVKCRERAKTSVWWPGLSTQVENLIKDCHKCAESQQDRTEPLIVTLLPLRPWQQVGSDLFCYKGATYLLVVDYFSRFIEVAKLSSQTSEDIIVHMKSIFSRHGIPEVLISDNGPQYASDRFSQFSKDFGFEHRTSSPRYAQSNGEAERAVQTIKKLLKKNGDPYKALLAYRAAPLANGYSPAELCMGRRIRTNVPIKPDLLNPHWTILDNVRLKELELKNKQKVNYDQRHSAKTLSQLQEGERVYVKDFKTRGTVVQQHSTPRSYVVETPRGRIRRNRRHLVPTSGPLIPETDHAQDIVNPSESSQNESCKKTCEPDCSVKQQNPAADKVYVTRSGRQSVPPKRMDL